jgi:hypothetical protein
VIAAWLTEDVPDWHCVDAAKRGPYRPVPHVARLADKYGIWREVAFLAKQQPKSDIFSGPLTTDRYSTFV